MTNSIIYDTNKTGRLRQCVILEMEAKLKDFLTVLKFAVDTKLVASIGTGWQRATEIGFWE